MVFRKTNLKPKLSQREIIHLQESLNLVPSGRRSSLSWFSSAKNCNFFCGRIYEIKFWEIISIPSSICLPQGNLLSSRIYWHLKFAFLVLFANLKFGILDLSLKFLKCEWVAILLDLKSLDLPELMLCCWRYVISAIHVTLWLVLTIIR